MSGVDPEVKKKLTELLEKCKIIEKNSVGQVVTHVNNGGVTKICYNNWEVK